MAPEKKVSANPGLTNGNPCYSLAGAVYWVYNNSRCDDTRDRVYVNGAPVVLTTDASGSTNTVNLEPGTYYIKEHTASKGFALDTVVHTATVSENASGTTVLCTSTEQPLDDPMRVSLKKADASTKGAPAGSAKVSGAVFRLTYYMNTDGNTSGQPAKTWYFETDATGMIACNRESYLVASKTLKTGMRLTSDALYKDAYGMVIYPIGTYLLKEVVPPEMFQLDGKMRIPETGSEVDVATGITLMVKQDGNDARLYDATQPLNQRVINVDNVTLEGYDEVYRGSVKLVKYDGDQKPVAGVVYQLTGLEDGSTFTATTGADGSASFDNLIPQKYVLTEISVPDGVTMLQDNMELTIPMQMTEAEANAAGADLSEAVWDEALQRYCFYNFTYTITNTVNFDLPMTGGSDHMVYLFGVAALILIGGGVFVLRKKEAVAK